MNQPIPTYNQVMAELCRRSLYFFFVEFWDEINSDKLHDNWHIKEVCDMLQEILEGVIARSEVNDDMLANVPPGTSKSTILSQMSLAWVWTRMPECVGIFSTIADKNAKDFSMKFRDIVTSDKYMAYFPEIVVRRDSSALDTIRNTLGGARIQYTTHSKKTGMHGHYIGIDDNMSFTDARSDTQAESCNEELKGLLTREKKNARVPKIFFMQMQSKIDTTMWVLERFPKIKRIVLPAWLSDKVFPPELKSKYIDGLLNPRHMNWEFLESKKLQLAFDGVGDIQYLAEYGQDCETSEGYLYTVNKVKSIENKGVSIAVCDPADDGECYTATVFARIYDNKCYVNDILYSQDSPEDKDGKEGTWTRNIKKAKEYKPFTFFIEKDGLGNIYGKNIKAKYPLVQPFNAKGDKIDRIFAKGNIISKYFFFLESSPNIEYENAVNHLSTYKRVGKNKFVDFEDVLTSLATVIERNGLINFYGK